MTLREWRNSKAWQLLAGIEFEPCLFILSRDMTPEEKATYPEHEAIGGYLKVCDTDKAYLNWWNSLMEPERDIIKRIPNFNPDKFLQITGIKVNN